MAYVSLVACLADSACCISAVVAVGNRTRANTGAAIGRRQLTCKQVSKGSQRQMQAKRSNKGAYVARVARIAVIAGRVNALGAVVHVAHTNAALAVVAGRLQATHGRKVNTPAHNNMQTTHATHPSRQAVCADGARARLAALAVGGRAERLALTKRNNLRKQKISTSQQTSEEKNAYESPVATGTCVARPGGALRAVGHVANRHAAAGAIGSRALQTS